jgi:hypothetical protein
MPLIDARCTRTGSLQLGQRQSDTFISIACSAVILFQVPPMLPSQIVILGFAFRLLGSGGSGLSDLSL